MEVQTYKSIPVFEANQVLTADLLNSAINYLEEQELLTRARLIGSGIVCGLKIDLRNNGSEIAISKGAGITSDGHLMVHADPEGEEEVIYKYFEVYKFQETVGDYSFFFKGNTPMELYRLRPEREGNKDPEVITAIPGGITGYGILLFLECYEQDNKLCGGNDCDNKGATLRFNIIPLLMKLDDMRDMICEEESLNAPKSEEEIDDYMNRHFKLAPLPVNRFRKQTFSLQSYQSLFELYDQLVNNLLLPLETQLLESYRLFRPLVSGLYPSENAFFNEVKTLKSKLLALEGTKPYTIQYFHAFLCDLSETYNEFREAVFDLMTACCPSLDRFPKHLRLGHFLQLQDCKPSPYRTRFLQPPIYNGQDALKNKVLSLHFRLFLMIKNSVNPLKFKELRITPSRELDRPLSDRSIPFYYNIDGAFLQNWSPELKRRCRQNEILSYHAADYANSDHIKNPLKYDLKPYDFLRIEGHLGRNYQNVLKELLSLRNENNLPFDIVALKIGKGPRSLAIDEMKCSFQDLETVCEAWKEEFACLIKGLIKDLSKPKIKDILGVAGEITKPATGGVINTGKITINQGKLALFYRQPDYRFQPEFDIIKQTKNSIDVSEDSIGSYVIDSFKFQGGTAKDYAAIAENNLLKVPEISNLAGSNNNAYQLGFKHPTEVITGAYSIAEILQNPCEAIDLETLRKAQSELITYAKAYYKKLLEYQNSNNKPINVEALLLLQTMSFFISHCSIEQFKIIKAEMDRRKAELAKYTLLHEFLLKHPGVDHAGGVPKGGTFILVYHEEEQPTPGIKRPFTATGILRDNQGNPLANAGIQIKGTAVATVSDASGKFILPVESGEETLVFAFPGLRTEERIVNPVINNIAIVLGADDPGRDKDLTPSNGAIVADFYLPYLCCSDCPSINYLLPPEKQLEISLTIDRTDFCEDDPREPFTVDPTDGIITGDGVETDEGNRFYFNPSLIDLGASDRRLIHFKVNDIEVPLTVTVYKNPIAVFSGEVGWREVQGGFQFVLKVSNNSQFAQRYEWSFTYFNSNGEKVTLPVVNKSTTEAFEQIFPEDIGSGPNAPIIANLIAIGSNDCRGTAEEIFQIPNPPRGITFEILDPQGNIVNQPAVIPNFNQGSYTLRVTPGKGELVPLPLGQNPLGVKLLDSNAELNTYIFEVLERPKASYSMNYKTAEGHTGALTIVVTALSGRPPVVDQNFANAVTENYRVLRALPRNLLFAEILGSDAIAFNNTAEQNNAMLKATDTALLYQNLMTPEFTKDFSISTEKAVEDVSTRIVKNSRNAKAQQLLLSLFQIQIVDSIQLTAIQKADLNAQSDLSKLMTVIGNEALKMKEKDIPLNKEKALIASINEAKKVLRGKAFATKKVDEILEKITQ